MPFQNDIEIKARSTSAQPREHAVFCELLVVEWRNVPISDVPWTGQLFLDQLIWVCFLAHENHQLLSTDQQWPPGCLPMPCNWLLHSWWREDSHPIPVPGLPLRLEAISMCQIQRSTYFVTSSFFYLVHIKVTALLIKLIGIRACLWCDI